MNLDPVVAYHFCPNLPEKILPTSELHFYPISVRIQYPLVDGVLTVTWIAFSVCPSIFIPEMQLNRTRNEPTIQLPPLWSSAERLRSPLRRQREGEGALLRDVRAARLLFVAIS